MTEAPQYLTEPQTARILGVSPKTLRRWRHRGRPFAPPHIDYPGGTLRYDKRKVIAWRELYVVAPDAEVEGVTP